MNKYLFFLLSLCSLTALELCSCSKVETESVCDIIDSIKCQSNNQFVYWHDHYWLKVEVSFDGFSVATVTNDKLLYDSIRKMIVDEAGTELVYEHVDIPAYHIDEKNDTYIPDNFNDSLEAYTVWNIDSLKIGLYYSAIIDSTSLSIYRIE